MDQKIDLFKEQISLILDIQEKLLNLDNSGNTVGTFIDFIEKNHQIILNPNLFQSFLESISSAISSRPLFEKQYIQIIQRYLSKIPKSFFFMFLSKSNMALALFLEKKLIDINDIEKNINSINHNSLIYFKDYIKSHSNSAVFNDIITKSDERKEKENQIAKIIREDDLESFQDIVNESNFIFNSKVPWSIFECVYFLNEEEMPNYIEYACFFGSIQIFKYLIGNDAIKSLEKNAQNGSNTKSLDRLGEFAVIGGNYEIIHILEDYGVKYNEKSLLNSIKFQRNEISDYLTNNIGIQPNIDSILMSVESNNLSYFINNFSTIFNFENEAHSIKSDLEKIWLKAAEFGRFEIIKFLGNSEFDFNKNVINETGQNILHIIISNGFLNIVEFLIEKKFCDLNYRDEFVFQKSYFYGVSINFFFI